MASAAFSVNEPLADRPGTMLRTILSLGHLHLRESRSVGHKTTSRSVAFRREAFNCRILYDHYLPTVILIVILIIIGIPSPTHSFTLGLNPSFSANPPYRSLSFFSFRIHYMDFPDCLLLGLLLSISVFLLFSFLFLHFFSCRFSAVD